MNSLMKKLAVVILGGSLLGSMPIQAITPREMLSSMTSQEMLSNLFEQTTNALFEEVYYDRTKELLGRGVATESPFMQVTKALMNALPHLCSKEAFLRMKKKFNILQNTHARVRRLLGIPS